MKVLYIEDNSMDADLLVRSFSRHAPTIDVDVARTYAEAVSKLETCTPRKPVYDLVLADINLPDGSGISILTFLHERRLPLAVVILTGAGNNDAVVSALKAGAIDYVIKKDDYLSRLPEILEKAALLYRTEIERCSQPIHILYADDDRDVDRIWQHFSRFAPYIHLEAAGSAEDVLLRLSEDRNLDVVLLNCHLPDMNGLMLLKELRQVRGLDIPVVLITDHGDEEIALQALKLGAMDYVVRNEGFLYRLPLVLEDAFHRTEIARDQAMLKRSEKRYHNLFQSSMEGIFQADSHGKFLIINPAFAGICGFASPEEMMADSDVGYKLFASSRDLSRFAALLKESCLVKGFETEFRRRDGRKIWVSINAKSNFDDKGRIACYEGTIQDITDKKRSEEMLRSSIEEKEVLLREIHHRINNNFQIISSLLSIQAGSMQDMEARSAFRECQNRIKSMALVHEKLYKSKDLGRIDLASYTQKLAKYILISHECPSEIGLNFKAEEISLKIETAIPFGLLVNELLFCLIKGAPSDDLPVEISMELKRECDGTVRLVISDNGAFKGWGIDLEGMPPLARHLIGLLTEQIQGDLKIDGSCGTRIEISFKELDYKDRFSRHNS